MALTQDEVRKIAQLARLELRDDELERQARHLNELLERFEMLQQLDLEDIEPTSHIMPMANVFRDDEMRPSLSRRDLLANSPDARDGCFVVPRILEG